MKIVIGHSTRDQRNIAGHSPVAASYRMTYRKSYPT